MSRPRVMIRSERSSAGIKFVTTYSSVGARASGTAIDSSYAWLRLGIVLLLGTIGSVGMWSFVVALPAVQADFGVARGEASLPFTLTMIGFGAGGIIAGRLADRFGVVIPLICGALALGVGYLASAFATNIVQFALAQGLLGLGSSTTFGPLIADISHWLARRRGLAVTISSARSGRRCFSFSSRVTAGAPPRSASVHSASSPCCRSAIFCAPIRRCTPQTPEPDPRWPCGASSASRPTR